MHRMLVAESNNHPGECLRPHCQLLDLVLPILSGDDVHEQLYQSVYLRSQVSRVSDRRQTPDA